MSQAPGTRIGHYEIVAPLGQGGMGVVYRARDLKLKREVAVKVLPPAVAADAERLARFQREAEVLASLNHPHIAQIYGIEESAGQHALVMEVVDGPTLGDRITAGPLPIDEVIAIARQLIDAMAFAHAHHVIHRDLKPANIKLTADGAVKVLDFGLAKALDPQASASGSQADSPTITSPAMTRAGMFLGTAAYMAPEQARAVAVDKRADIWAFGVVLFEMLTGERLFEGETVSDTLANVLKNEPDWQKLPRDTPAGLRRLLRHCLTRDRKLRLQDIGDATFALEAADDRVDSVPGPRTPPRAWVYPVAGVGAALAIVLTALPRWLDTGTVTAPPVVQFLITPADGVDLEDPPVFNMSPDGRHIALRGYGEGGVHWFIKTLSTGRLQRLDGTRNSGLLVFSPDGQWVAFIVRNILHKVAIDGTRLQSLTKTPMFGTPGAWLTNGDILFASNGRIYKVADSGGDPQLVTASTAAEVSFMAAPSFLPGSGEFLAVEVTTATMIKASVDGAIRRLEGGLNPAYSPPGWLLATRGPQLLRWSFDAATGAIAGQPEVVVENVLTRTGAVGRGFSVSRSGVLAYRNDTGQQPAKLVWFDRDGTEGASLKLTLSCRNPEFAPDGTKLAIECYEEPTSNRDVWIYDVRRNSATRFTTDAADDADPVWSPDGRTVAFASSRKGPPDIFLKAAGGAEPEILFAETRGPTPLMAWSPDAKTMLVMESAVQDVSILDVEGDKKMRAFLNQPFQELEPQFSPDGKFVSYSSDESGRSEIYVQPWPPNGNKWQVSTDGGFDGRWRPDGREIFYLNARRELMAVSIESDREFNAASPVRLFQTRVTGPLGTGHRFPYAVARDGKRFVMYVSAGGEKPPSITVVLNWPSLLKR